VFLHDYNYVPQPSMFWRRKLYDAVGGLNADFQIAMDNDLWEKFSARTRIAHIPFYLSCMRYYAEQKTNTQGMRPTGRREGRSVVLRGSRIANAQSLRPMLAVIARLMRVAQKGVAGGYTAAVPDELLPWLDAHATHGPEP
jgi:hypothetical protein